MEAKSNNTEDSTNIWQPLGLCENHHPQSTLNTLSKTLDPCEIHKYVEVKQHILNNQWVNKEITKKEKILWDK